MRYTRIRLYVTRWSGLRFTSESLSYTATNNVV